MNNDPPFNIIIITIFIVLVVIIVVWAVTVKKTPVLPTISGYAPSQLGMRCIATPTPSSDVSVAPNAFTPQPCDQGLVCIQAGTTGSFCRKAIGSPCTSLYECVPEALMCTGVCSITAGGGINQPCLTDGTCNSGLECVAPTGSTGGAKVCKYSTGTSNCSQSSDCVSGRCVESTTGSTTCQAPLTLGQACHVTATDTAPCGSQYACVTGSNGSYCQPSNLSSNGVGAVCYYPASGGSSSNSAVCPTGLSCAYDYVNGGPVADAEYGYCASSTQKWQGLCSNSVACGPPTICSSGTCVVPTDNSGNSIINTCGDQTSYQCNSGFVCSNSICVSQSGQTCTYNSDCQSGNCASWALMNWQMTPGTGASTALGVWNNTVPISVPPQKGACLSVAQVAGSGTSYTSYILYYQGAGSKTFYVYSQASGSTTVTTYTYNIIVTGSVTIQTIKSVKLSPLGNILVHANISNVLNNPIRPGNPTSGSTTTHAYDRIFAFVLSPNTNGTTTNVSLGDKVGPYFSGSTEITTLDVYDVDDKNARFGFIQATSSTLWTNTLSTTSSMVTQLNQFYSISTSVTVPNWSTTGPVIWFKYYIDSNGGVSNANVMYLLKGATNIVSIDQKTTYPQVAKTPLYGLGLVLNTNNPISNVALYYTTSTEFRYTHGATDIGLPGYPSQITQYSTLTNAVPTPSLIAQGGIDLSMYTINQVCA